MAQQYIGSYRGMDGFKLSDFTTGTSSTAGLDMELRFNDAVSLTKKDIHIFLEGVERFLSGKLGSTVPKL